MKKLCLFIALFFVSVLAYGQDVPVPTFGTSDKGFTQAIEQFDADCEAICVPSPAGLVFCFAVKDNAIHGLMTADMNGTALLVADCRPEDAELSWLNPNLSYEQTGQLWAIVLNVIEDCRRQLAKERGEKTL